MSTFPTYAQILHDGFGEQRESALLRSEMESGPAKQVRIRSRIMITRQVQVVLNTKADYQSFVVWFRDTINEGADWFDWLDPVSGSVKSVRLVGGGLNASPVAHPSGPWSITGLRLESWGS